VGASREREVYNRILGANDEACAAGDDSHGAGVAAGRGRLQQKLRRRLFPNRKVVVIWIVALIALLPMAGLVYEAYADGVAGLEFEAPGTRVDIGGRSLHLLCIGEGEPTVFFETSGWGNSLSDSRVRERLAGQTTVCSYDRAGNGWSDPGPSEASAGDLARDLAILQDRGEVRWPVVLVASSIGGLTAEMFTRQFPERVAGLVLVDAANSELLPALEGIRGRARTVLCATSMLARFGLVRLVDPFDFGDSAETRRSAALTYNPRPWAQLCAIVRGLEQTEQEFRDAPPLATDLPLAVLSASSADGLAPPGSDALVDIGEGYDLLQASHKRIALKSNLGRWEIVPDSTHLIGASQPDALSQVIVEMLERLGGT
jgi:pimeloyl-ACP methyl ester carboxylesterase